MNYQGLITIVRKITTNNQSPKVCIIGAGPAGFSTAQKLLKSVGNMTVDLIERLPVPFGLIRYGVAPDHPEVKNIISSFEKTTRNPRCRFFGNVHVGKDVTIEELKNCYHAVVLAYGAEEDKLLNIPGENLPNVLSGRRFVGWYNGFPSDKNYEINLDVEEAVIVGQGNVALDIARILLTPVDKLRKTDITSYALEKLSRSKIRKVHLVGRRGPLHAAFSTAELREILKLESCKTYWREQDFASLRDLDMSEFPRPRRRLTELMLKSLGDQSSIQKEHVRKLLPIFLRSPYEFTGSSAVTGVKMHVNELVGYDLLDTMAKATEETEEIPCGLVLRSIGYRSIPIENVPFDSNNGRVQHKQGKVGKGLYTAGWVATGPTGVILTTLSNAYEVVNYMQRDLKFEESKPGTEEFLKILLNRRVKVVMYEHWLKIDEEEIKRGKALGKCREKIVDIEEMVDVALK